MNEYNVSVTVVDDRSILCDVHGAAGTSRIARFETTDALRGFFSSLGLHEDKVAEFVTACARLNAGEAYHESMYLPEMIVDALQAATVPAISSANAA